MSNSESGYVMFNVYKKFVEHSFLFTLVKRNECGRISFRSVSVRGAYLVLPRDPTPKLLQDLGGN